MRLVSKIHDYYDGVIRSTVSDKTHTFVREPYDLEDGSEFHVLRLNELECRNYKYNLMCELVGFCGEIYPCVRIEKTPDDGCYSAPTEIIYAYDMETFRWNVPLEQCKSRRYSSLFGYGSDTKTVGNWFNSGRDRISWFSKDVYESKNDPELLKLFREHRIAYFHIDKVNRRSNPVVHVYPVLKDIQFYKVFDAYTTFQMIEHYLVNELIRPDEIAQHIQDSITDELKVQAHGFDKWSFRKEPKGKK